MEPETTQRYGVVFVTATSQAEVEAIAEALITAKLAACVSFTPIHSVYTWQGQVHKDQEWQLLIKTDLTKFAALVAKVQEVHSYDVPEIIALPIVAGSPSYLQWIGEQVGEELTS
uniref:divalent-cation tolerance protein CutA n=1 Tax=Trichocoleus desertorum TaxID=1481672 RepID=UPI0025B59BAB|nr:divalent-cation tolerance protein CutA [Trichocoleus desertorum]